MKPIPVNLAVEDDLSEAVLRRLINEADRGYAVGTVYGRSGFGYLKKTIAGWNKAAKSIPFVVLTDLDQCPCPPSLLRNWLPLDNRHPNLLLRIAVREVESWLLADSQHLAQFLGCPVSRIPKRPESLPDPKRTLVSLAATSRRSAIRDRLVPKPRSTAQQGPDYNACLSTFVLSGWQIADASANSPSLAKAVQRLCDFVPTWNVE